MSWAPSSGGVSPLRALTRCGPHAWFCWTRAGGEGVGSAAAAKPGVHPALVLCAHYGPGRLGLGRRADGRPARCVALALPKMSRPHRLCLTRSVWGRPGGAQGLRHSHSAQDVGGGPAGGGAYTVGQLNASAAGKDAFFARKLQENAMRCGRRVSPHMLCSWADPSALQAGSFATQPGWKVRGLWLRAQRRAAAGQQQPGTSHDWWWVRSSAVLSLTPPRECLLARSSWTSCPPRCLTASAG